MTEFNHQTRVLITGSRGMLGTEIGELFKRHFPNIQLVETDYQDLDITQSLRVEKLVGDFKPHWIINAAAYTDVDKSESERDCAFELNAVGPKNLAEGASRVGAQLVHFSTDYVFSGEGDAAWKETDPARPLERNWYGQTKRTGEQFVLKNPNHLVFRIQWLYGLKRERFSALKQKSEFTPFVDQIGAPTWTRDVAQTIIPVMQKGGRGLFHFSYDDFASWWDVYEFIKREWRLSVHLIPKKSSEVSLPAERPLNGRLSNEKLKRFLGVPEIGSWKDSLKNFLALIPS